MKKFLKMAAAVAAILMALSFASCSDDDDDDGDETTSQLPASVGTNELSGTTWTAANGYATFSFTDSVATSKFTSGSYFNEVKYSYSYNSTSKLLYLKMISLAEGNSESSVTISSVDEYIAEMKKNAQKYNENWDDTRETVERAEATIWLNTIIVSKYALDGNSLSMAEYFDGNFPTAANFSYDLDTNGSYLDFGSRLKIKDKSGDEKMYYYAYPTDYSDGKFSATLYKTADKETYTSLGTVAGTYSSTGTGTSGCKVTVTFTTLPSSVSIVKTGTAYTLEMEDGETTTYTKSN